MMHISRMLLGISLCCATLFPLHILAQFDTLSADEIERRWKPDGDSIQSLLSGPFINVDYSINAGANTVTWGSLFDFYSADFVDDRLKTSMLGGLNAKNNRFGLSQTAKVEYGMSSYFSKRSRTVHRHAVHLAMRSLNGANVPEDALLLFFYGNKPFAGEELDLGPSAFYSANFSELGYSYSRSNSKWKTNYQLALLVGHSFNSLRMERGKLFTEASGESIDFDLRYEWASANPDGNAFALNGLGASLGMSGAYTGSEKYTFRWSVSDVGLINYFDRTTIARADTAFHFEGLVIDNVFQVNDSIVQAGRRQLSDGVYAEKDARYNLWLPPRIFLEFERYIFGGEEVEQGYSHPTLGIKASVAHRFIPGYFPFFSAGPHFYFSPDHHLESAVTYGRFSRLGVRLKYSFRTDTGIHMKIGVDNLQSLPFASDSYGLGFNFGLRKEF